MRRAFTVGCVGLLLATASGFSQAIPDLVARHGYADLVLLNGKIVSMDDRSIAPNTPGNIYEAMAVKGKRILALGTNREMRDLAGPRTRFLDAGGRTVIPGLIQTHYHLFGPAAGRYGPQVGLVDPSIKITVVAEATAEGTSKKIRDTVANAIRSQNIPKGEWISVSLQEGPENRPSTNRTWLYRSMINRRTTQLDTAAPDNQVVVGARQGGLFNAAAIRAFEEVFPDWEESTIAERGEATAAQDGYVAVPELQGLTFAYWWKDEPIEKLAEALRLHGTQMQKKGMTSVSTRLLFPSVVQAYNQLNREGKMPHRLSYYIEAQRGAFFDLKSTREFYQGFGAPWTNHAGGGEMLWLGGMCNEVWDSSENHVCLGPDMPASEDIKARERCPSPGTRPWEAVKTAVMTGWRPVAVHGTSSHGVRLYIQMLEEAMREANLSAEHIRSLRTTMEHNFVLGTPPDVMAKIKEYGIILNVNTAYLEWARVLIEDYGERLRPFAMPVKTWVEDGIRVTFESDGDDFWTPIYRLVTREITNPLTDEKEVLLPDQAVDRVTALKMTTTWASEYLLAEDTLGTLEPGKYADFVVLEKDFFEVPVGEIPQTKVILTGLGGEVVYDRDGIAGRN